MAISNSERRQLRAQSTLVVPGFATLSPAAELMALAQWCESHAADNDVYGEGGLLAAFEQQIARLLGKPAAVFMPTGVLAQLVAVRIYTEKAGLARFGMSANSHLALHEHEAFQSLWGMHGVPIGSRLRPMLASDLAAVHQPLACAIVELPIREAGGQLPDWDQLQALKAQAADTRTPLHMDGARLWQCRAFYQRSYAEIASGFDSVYVSFYKDIGGMSGAMLVGDEAFIANARLWQRRMGGNPVQQTAVVASAMVRFEQRLSMLEACYQRACTLAAGLGAVTGLRVNPGTPQTNMMHLYFDAPADALNAARDHLAQTEQCWLFGMARPCDVPGWSYVELTVGDHLLAHDNARIVPLFQRLLTTAQSDHTGR